MNTIKFWIVFCILIVSSGCAHQYIPDSSTPVDNVPVSTKQVQIALKNVQLSDEKIVVYKSGQHTMYANRKEWTDSAIKVAHLSLSRKGYNVTDNATKFLNLSVEQIKTDPGAWYIVTQLIMNVETGDGYKAQYTVSDKIMNVIFKSVYGQYDTVILKAVTEMLMDEKIIQYLN